MAHRNDTPQKKGSNGDELLSTRTLVLVSIAIAVPWLGFQILQDDPALRPGLLDNALMGILGVWLTRLGAATYRGGDKGGSDK